jgi:hypothetical protein
MHFDGNEPARIRGKFLTATKIQMYSHLMPYQRVGEGRGDVRWEFCVIVFVSRFFLPGGSTPLPVEASKRRSVEASNSWWLELDKLR